MLKLMSNMSDIAELPSTAGGKGQSQPLPKGNQGRAETERRLIEAALELIKRNGILAGLNLREVAAAAGVNRGNIYHYFGSRQELLREAIARRFRAIRKHLDADFGGLPFVERRTGQFRGDSFQDSKLRALLVQLWRSDGAPQPGSPRKGDDLARAVVDMWRGDDYRDYLAVGGAVASGVPALERLSPARRSPGVRRVH